MQEPIFENIRFNRDCGTFVDKLRLDGKTDIPCDTVEKVLDVNAFVSLTEKEVSAGKIKYGGNIIYQVIYQDVNGVLKKYECGNEYLGVINDEKISEACSACVSVKAEKSEADLSGLKVSVYAVLKVTATLYACENISALSGGEGLIVDKKEFPMVKSYGIKKSTYPVEEEFVIDFPVAEVLSHSVKSVITNVQCGVGCIIVDGEVILSVLFLQKAENSDVIRESRVLPFRMEIEYEEAMPVMQATARVAEKSFKSDISVDGETGKSTVDLKVALLFEGEAFSDEAVTLAADVFNITENIEISCEDFCARKPCEMRSFSKSVNGRAAVNELPVDSRLMAVGGENAEIVSVSVKENSVTVDGVISTNGFFRTGEGKNFSAVMETPFSVDLEQNFCAETSLEVFVTVRSISAKIVSLTETEIDAELLITVYPSEKQTIRYIKEVKACGEKKPETAAISVYIPLEGEELWSLAKRLNVCPEEVVATNKDLQFPLTGKERIVIYRQMC